MKTRLFRLPQEPLQHIHSGLGPGGSDEIIIEILDSGDIKVTTDPISGPNHMSAEGFLRNIGELAGGETTRRRRVRQTNTQQKQSVDQTIKHK
jgi:hypothetical protein